MKLTNSSTWTTFLVTALLHIGTAHAATTETVDFDALGRSVDEIFSAYGNDTPGCAVGVIHRGDYIFKKGYGMANLEHDIPITPETIFRMGSVSKQFTATVLAILAERGEIDLDADIHTYLPDLIDYGHRVTVRQVIHHTAGMQDYEEGLFFKPDGSEFRFGNEDYWTIEEFYEAVREVPLRTPPGTEWYYSNLGYFLLSQVVERATGKSLRQVAQEEIFAPLGMNETFFNDNVDEPIKNRAAAYWNRDDGSYEIYMTNLDWVGDGGVFTNLEDFIHWDRNFDANRIGSGSQELIETITGPHAPMDSNWRGAWDESAYGYGLFVGTRNGRRVIGHTGGWVGFTTIYHRHPDDRISVVTFCNSTDADAMVLGVEVAEIYLRALSGSTPSAASRTITELFENQFVENWQKGDAAALADLWVEDGDWSSVVGSRRVVEGVQNLEGVWAVGLQGRDTPESRAIAVAVDNIRFLGLDHALVDVLMEFTPGTDTAIREAFVFVTREQAGVWKIVSARAARVPNPR